MSHPAARPDRWDFVLLLGGLAGLGVALSGAAAAMTVFAVSLGAGRVDDALLSEYVSVAQLATAAFCLPALLLGVRSILGWPRLPARRLDRRWAWLLAVYPLGVILGVLAYEWDVSPYLFLPAAQILTAVPPAGLAILLVQPASEVTPRRLWGRFTGGMLFVPLASIILEAFGVVLLLLVIAMALILTPGGAQLLNELAAVGAATASPSAQELEELMARLLRQPAIVGPGLLFIAAFVPLIEEMFKTVGVWPWLRRGLTAGEAFAGGAICGAGYGLFEALFSTPPGDSWMTTVLARSGATLMHAFAAGLSSWGLMEGLGRRAWGKALAGCSLAVLLHGTWNAIAVWTAGLELSRLLTSDEGMVASAGGSALGLGLLGGLSLAAAAGLLLLGRHLQPDGAPPPPAIGPPPPAA